VDAGAGTGDFAILASRLFPAAEIVCFEPDARYFDLLPANLRANGCGNVVPHRVALGDGRGSRRLADFVAGEISLLKIDCEGAELDILDGLGPDRLAQVDRIALEYHDVFVPSQARQRTARLGAAGFPCRIAPDRWEPRLGYVFATRAR
jgi:tRNA G37 N-methylase Trm5